MNGRKIICPGLLTARGPFGVVTWVTWSNSAASKVQKKQRLISKDSSQNITKAINKFHVWHTIRLYVHIYHEQINQIHAYRHLEITQCSFKSYRFSSLVLPFCWRFLRHQVIYHGYPMKKTQPTTGNPTPTPTPAFSGLFRRSFCCWGVGLHGSATKGGKKVLVHGSVNLKHI